MKNIYGTIGYTLLVEPKSNKKIIILADMHDTLPQCTNQTNVSDWFKSKFNSSKILLEEVPRDNFSLSELWSTSPHTQNLKNLFLSNSNLIHAVDIRPYLIPFSWEILSDIKISKDDPESLGYDIMLKTYLVKISNFYSLKEQYFLKNLPNYKIDILPHTKLGKHFLLIKKNWKMFLENYKELLNSKIVLIYQDNKKVLEEISKMLDEIMEWYICASIHVYSDQSIILHTGLAHSDSVIKWLLNHYKYIISTSEGINSMDEVLLKPLSGCVQIPTNIETQFGGINSDCITGFFA
jgi:hypothetical protein